MDTPSPSRPAWKLTVLLAAWVVGLCVFAAYLILVVYYLFKWFG